MSDFKNLDNPQTEKESIDIEQEYQADLITQHIRTSWEKNLRAKQEIEQEILSNLLQREGKYDSNQLARIRATEMSEAYVMLTSGKCRAIEAWIIDILESSKEKPWSIVPTPIPKLNDEDRERIEENIRTELSAMAMVYAQKTGKRVMPQQVERMVTQEMKRKEKIILSDVRMEAKEKAGMMEDEIADQLEEGNFYNAFKQVVKDVVNLPAGILKGPVIRRKPVQVWEQNEDGQYVLETKQKLIPQFQRVSPLDVYPAPGAIDINDGDLIEVVRLTRKELNQLRGVPGYSIKALDRVLDTLRDGFREAQRYQSTDRARGENQSTLMEYEDGKIDCLEYWGTIPGHKLKDWYKSNNITKKDGELKGKELNDFDEYDVHAWLINDVVIKAVLNSDPMGRRPYAVASYETVNGSVWGHGVPYIIRDIQDSVNDLARAMLNNAAISSGPQVEVDVSKIPDTYDNSKPLKPWAKWPVEHNEIKDGKALHFYQPDIIINELLVLFNRFNELADQHLGVPAFQHGSVDVGMAGETASGLSMLMTSAARGIKNVIQHIDTGVIAPLIQRMYEYNMKYNEREDIKGDSQVDAKGTSALIANEIQQRRRIEMLQLFNNPIDLQLLGPEVRKAIIEQIIKDLDLDIDFDAISDPSRLEQVSEMFAAQRQSMINQPVMEERQMSLQEQQAAARGGAQRGAGVTTGANAPSGLRQSRPNRGLGVGLRTAAENIPNEQIMTPGGAPAGGRQSNAFAMQKGERPQ